jgi:Na+-driven multidrug efflux pump
LPAVYLYGLVDAERRFLNCLKRNFVTLMVQSIGTLFHIFACYFFVDILNYDIQGIGLASIITNLIMLILIIIYSRNIPEIKEAVKSGA